MQALYSKNVILSPIFIQLNRITLFFKLCNISNLNASLNKELRNKNRNTRKLKCLYLFINETLKGHAFHLKIFTEIMQRKIKSILIILVRIITSLSLNHKYVSRILKKKKDLQLAQRNINIAYHKIDNTGF